MEKIGPTDVLSFPADGPVPQTTVPSSRVNRSRQQSSRPRDRKVRGAEPYSSTSSTSSTSSKPYLGDIAIAPAVARRNARRFGRAFDHELRILILHGLLHLMGYDHESDSGQMDRRENRLRRELGLL